MTVTFESLKQMIVKERHGQAVEHLCESLRDSKDYHSLFYALLLKKRLELGMPAVQVANIDNLPEKTQAAYEEAIREAARLVGGLYLEAGDIPAAWPFFRTINEPAKVAEAIEKFHSEDPEACQQIIDIALHQGVNPQKGFRLVLDRYGICSSITMMSQELPFPAEVRHDLLKQLVRALHRELHARLISDVERRGIAGIDTAALENESISAIIGGRDWLFEDEAYHIDLSHLSSVVRFSLSLPACPELDLAIELCEYGKRVSPRLRYEGNPPFDEQHHDEQIYLRTVSGKDVDAGIAHFRAKVEKFSIEEAGTMPAETLVNLLVRVGRHSEAVEIFSRYLADADARQLSCPGLPELCEKAGDYRAMVRVAERRGDWVNFVAGLLQTSSVN